MEAVVRVDPALHSKNKNDKGEFNLILIFYAHHLHSSRKKCLYDLDPD